MFDWIKRLFGFKSKCSCEESNCHCEDGKCECDDEKEVVSSTPMTEDPSKTMITPAPIETPIAPSDEPIFTPAPEEKLSDQL